MKQVKNSKISIFKDYIHNYIHITPIEKRIIEDKRFQRLRFIGQNSLAYFTYASNHSNRFCHSIGVMHLGGRMFKSAIENSSNEDLIHFLEQSYIFVSTQTNAVLPIKELLRSWNDHYGNIAEINHPVLDEINYKNGTVVNGESTISKIGGCSNAVALLNILWQSTRIASILHDIGHLPCSHLFEYAMENYSANHEILSSNNGNIVNEYLDKMNQDYTSNLETLGIKETYVLPLHEKIGIQLMMDIIPQEQKVEPYRLTQACIRLSKIVFVINKGKTKPEDKPSSHQYDPVKSAIICLHTIISSDLDADRLDYCVRDAKASSTELGAIDIDRIVDSLILYYDKSVTPHEFKIVLEPRSLSGIEEFFHQRYLLYKFIIYHHNVIRCDKALELLLRRIIEIYEKRINVEIVNILEKFEFVKKVDGKHIFLGKTDSDGKSNFEFYDDFWLRTLLQHIYDEAKKDSAINSTDLIPILEVVLYRKIEHIRSLWKRESDIHNSIEDIELLVKERMNTIDMNIPETSNYSSAISSSINELEIYGCEQFTLISQLLKDKLGVTLIVGQSSPKVFNDENPVQIFTKKGLVNASTISKYLSSLKDMGMKVVRPRFFFLKKDLRKDDNLYGECVDIFNTFIVECVIRNINQNQI